jgi:amino acid transporter
MEADRTYSASTSTVTPLLARPKGVRSLPKAFDGFLRNSAYNPDAPVNGRVFDHKQAAFNTANTALVKKLKGRHLQMIAIGGSIGKFRSVV